MIRFLIFMSVLLLPVFAHSQEPSPSPTILSQAQQNKSERQQTKGNDHQRGTDDSPITVKIVGTANTNTEISNIAKKTDYESLTNGLLVFFNCLLAIFTYLLYRSTEKLWQAGEKQMKITQASVDLASKELILTQRPKLKVSNVIIRPPQGRYELFERGQYISGQFNVSNIGGTPATIINVGCWVYWDVARSLPMERPYEGKNGNIPFTYILNPGESTPIPFQSETTMDIEGNWIIVGSHIIHIMGWIEYRDDLQINRRIVFCRRYWPGGRFEAIVDPDYETYQDE